ncbi:tetraacyldisaccharide 4'-kinase [Ahrensia kielensis]|uniref:tetraacyldisaccharide 4'-kinase n=1 Tax=Ahrensia kielensis TaxID=76980 RepID=UPI00037CCE41|nr:tetraacyldisaccharide 4'-kinase [Ahrensia kielensis]
MAGNETPPFWYEAPGWKSRLAGPISAIYGAVARRRMDKADPKRVLAPVLCIGNLTVGGTGKTPTAIAIAIAAKKHKYRPGFVSRGYGGIHVRSHLVDPKSDTVTAVGDEPLLLARYAPTIVGHNRANSAQALIDQGCDFIIMDDGFQSRTLHYDYALITLDARRGIGNGSVIPGGPLRAPLIDQMRWATAILRIGDGDRGDRVIRAAARAAKPIMHGHLKPAHVRGISKKNVLAFAGIGDPTKFYETLANYGCKLVGKHSFADHHVYTHSDARHLLDKANAEGLELVTTEKDAVRLTHIEGPLAELRERTHVLPVSLVFEAETDVDSIILETAEKYHQSRIKNGSI